MKTLEIREVKTQQSPFNVLKKYNIKFRTTFFDIFYRYYLVDCWARYLPFYQQGWGTARRTGRSCKHGESPWGCCTGSPGPSCLHSILTRIYFSINILNKDVCIFSLRFSVSCLKDIWDTLYWNIRIYIPCIFSLRWSVSYLKDIWDTLYWNIRIYTLYF